MIPVTLLALGRLKEDYLRAAESEYKKRLSRYCRLQLTELTPVTLPSDPSRALIDAALEKEAALIEAQIPKGALVIALCPEGKSETSEQFAADLAALENAGRPLCLIVGSSYGLSPSVKTRADRRLSFSPMTFPHQLFRILLLEQLYRGFKINEGSTYHK